MGSAIVKQRTYRRGKIKPSRKIEKSASGTPAQDKYGQSHLKEEGSIDLSSRSTQSAYLNGQSKSPSQEQQKSWHQESSNRKKKRLHQHLNMTKLFVNPNREHSEDISFIGLETSPNIDHKESMSHDLSDGKKCPALQSGTPRRVSYSPKGDFHSTFIQRKDNNLNDKSQSLQYQAGSEDLVVILANAVNGESLSKHTFKENSNGDLDDTDVCRDARTPSPQFDELENVALMSCKPIENKPTMVRCSSLDSLEGQSEKAEEDTHENQMPKECKNKNLHIKDRSEKKCLHTPKMESHVSQRLPVREDGTMEQTRISQQDLAPNLETINFPEGSEGYANSPTVNHPVVENVLASGDDYVNSLDEKFVMRGHLSVQDLDGQSDVSCDSLPEGDDTKAAQNGRRIAPEGSSSSHEEQETDAKPESPPIDEVFGGQRNNSQTANYSDWPYNSGLSLEKIECIQRQVYQEGLAPMSADGGVAFFVPVEESGMQPSTGKANAKYPSRLRVSRKCGLSYEERRFLADVNRTKQLDKRKEFAVKQNKSVVGKLTNPTNEDDSTFGIDTHSVNGKPLGQP